MRKLKVFLLAVAGLVLALTLFLLPVANISAVPGAMNWTKYDANPVLEGSTDPAAWDYGGVGAASVIQDGASFKMWYTGIATGPVLAIGYATSDTGTRWVKSTANPVLTKSGSDFDKDGVGSCTVIKESDTSYKMWYTGYSNATGTRIPAIGYATSNNGIAWINQQAVVLQKSSWDDAGDLSPIVIKEDGTYKMWYTGRQGDSPDVIGTIQIGYAESPDGITWTPYSGNPVIPKGATGEWDERGVGVGSILIFVGQLNKYNIWYTGYKGSGKASLDMAIGHADSPDGITWEKGDVELTKEGTGWEEYGVGAPWVLKTGTVYRIWYSGIDSNWEPTIGYAQLAIAGGGGGGGGGSQIDITPPAISDIIVSNLTVNSADISWTTNEWSTSQVEYWASPGLLTPIDDAYTIQHIMHLTELSPATNYSFRTMSKDKAGNQTVSDVQEFSTRGTPATFSVRTIEIDPIVANPGDKIDCSILVANTGDAQGVFRATLEVDKTVVASKDVTLAAGATQKVTITVSKDVPGSYTVNMGGLASTFTVRAPAPPPSPTSSPTPLPTPIPPKSAMNWLLIGGIVAAVVAASVVVWMTVVRRRM